MKNLIFYVLAYEETDGMGDKMVASDEVFLDFFKDIYKSYDAEGFAKAFNDGDFNSELDFLRIIEEKATYSDIDRLKSLTKSVDEDLRGSLDRVYNEILMPAFIDYAQRTKSNKIRITNDQFGSKGLMRELFGGGNLQSLIQTKMKPYLEEKGYKVHVWSPAYSVEVSW